MTFEARFIKAAPGANLRGAAYPTTNYPAAEVAMRATAPDLFLDAADRYCRGQLAGDKLSDFVWRTALGDEDFIPFGVAKPLLVPWTSRKAFRFGFGGLTTGSDGRNGALVQASGQTIMPRDAAYTLAYTFRAPLPSTEGAPANTGSVMLGGRLAANYFRSGLVNSTGRVDHRHQSILPASFVADYRTGAPVSVLYAFDHATSKISLRVDGAPIAAMTDATYSDAFAATDAALQWMIGGFGSTTVGGSSIFDVAHVMLWKGKCLAGAAGADLTADLAAVEAYMAAERAKF